MVRRFLSAAVSCLAVVALSLTALPGTGGADTPAGPSTLHPCGEYACGGLPPGVFTVWTQVVESTVASEPVQAEPRVLGTWDNNRGGRHNGYHVRFASEVSTPPTKTGWWIHSDSLVVQAGFVKDRNDQFGLVRKAVFWSEGPPPAAPPTPGPTPPPIPPSGPGAGVALPGGPPGPAGTPPPDPVEVTRRALETNLSAAESCMAGAVDYVAAIRALGVDIVGQLLRTELELLPAADAVGPAVADIRAFLDNPFDYKSAQADPARWLCGQLVGLAVDVGIGKLARGAPKALDELVPDLAGDVPGLRLGDELVSDPNVLARLTGRCLANSFVPSTEVLLGDGSTRRIDQVGAGTEVLAADPVSGRVGSRPVTGTITGSGRKDLVDLTIDGAEVTATAGHPFWRAATGDWADAGQLVAGDVVQGLRGGVGVEQVRRRSAEATVHNLVVADLHTYYVIAGDAPVLVHNAGCSPADRISALRAIPRIENPARLDDILRKAEQGQVGALGELSALEHYAARGKAVELLEETKNVKIVRSSDGQSVPKKNPDFFLPAEQQLVDVKTRKDPISDAIIKQFVKDANEQVRDSGHPHSTNGAVHIELLGDGSTGSPDAKITAQVLAQFRPDQSRSLGRVSVHRDGALSLEWVRDPDGTIRQTLGAP